MVIQFVYNLILFPLGLILALLIGFPFIRKIRQGLLLRFYYKFPKPKPNGELVWIHCASGEFEYAKPVIRELKKRKKKILVTYYSPSYLNQIKKDPYVDFVAPLPLDLPGPLDDFINYFNPELLLIARTDLWPRLMSALKAKQIPVVLFSTTFAKKPFINLMFTRPLYNQLNKIYAVSEEDKSNLAQSGINISTEVIGDTRFDQALYRIKNSPPLENKDWLISDIPILIAGSTWSQDEAQLLPAIEELLKQNKLRLIIAPHEPTKDHVTHLQSHFKKRSLGVDLFTKLDSPWQSPVLIVDTVGVLANLYPLAQLAFVGGSFKRKVHSVMEALVCGLVTFVGPYIDNNREALQFNKLNLNDQLQAVTLCKDKNQLQEKILLALGENPDANKTIIRQEINKQLGASKKLVERLYLENTIH